MRLFMSLSQLNKELLSLSPEVLIREQLRGVWGEAGLVTLVCSQPTVRDGCGGLWVGIESLTWGKAPGSLAGCEL